MRTLAEWLTLQESVHPKSIDMELGRVAAVARALQLDTPAFPVITVAGTNGKGSVVAHVEALLRSLGASTGAFTSPHFARYNERVRLGGADVGDAPLIAAFERIEAARGATTLSFFEYNTLAALLVFAEAAVDVAVLEVGLGGRLDATNLVDADVAVLASVGFDHRDWLGDTLELIGAEKAGIFRTGRAAVLGTAEMPASVYAAISSLGARGYVAERDFSWRVTGGHWNYKGLTHTLDDLPPSALAGAIQYRNAATALAAVEALIAGTARAPTGAPRHLRLAPLTTAAAARALRSVRLAGRFQVIPGAVEWVLDIAHNEPAAQVLAAQLREREHAEAAGRRGPRGRTIAVLGVLADKDAAAIAAALAPVVDRWIACTLSGPRGRSAPQLAECLGASAPVELAPDVTAGCELARRISAPGDRVVVCGSVHTVGPALEWLGLY